MLSEYREKQELAYNLFSSDIKNNCVTHAYLIDENNSSLAFSMVMSFVKTILCNNKLENHNECGDCVLCKRIDEGNYPEVKIITPEGLYIKKQQIIQLQQEFSRSSIEGKKRIYIIRDCDKMRTEAANSMLKFLEEPEDGIIAILMTNNINNVLSTIVSRCKIVKLNGDSVVNNAEEELNDLALNFVLMLERNYFELFMKIKEVFFSKVSAKERDRIVSFLDIVLDIYYDILKVSINNSNIKYFEWFDDIKDISKLNNLDGILKKIDILLNAKDSVKFNVNCNLLFDSIILSIGGINNGSRY